MQPSGRETQHAVPRVVHVLVPRLLTVDRVTELSRAMRRVTLTGGLAGFAALAATDHAKVFFPPDDTSPPAMPVVTDGHWTNRADPRLVYRDYTVRAFRPERGEVDLDMVVHSHGPAGRWAARARPGQQLGLLGPRSSTMRPLDREWYLLAADETGLPATANWLERLPASAHVDVLVEVGGPEDEVELPVHDGASITWVHRGATPPGASTLLPDAVAATRLGTGPGYVWAAAEASQVRAIRADVRTRGIGGDSASPTGYWRLGVANFDHKSPEA